MSSLPPYNPRHSERSLWLLNDATPAPDRKLLLDSVAPSEVVEATAAAGLVDRLMASTGEILVIGPELMLQGLVLELVGGRVGTASLRFMPGALSQVRLLKDRAVLRHLNIGRAV